jgi:hypothetical protein
VTLSPPSIVRYVTGRRVACRALHRPRIRVTDCSSARRKTGPRMPFRFALSRVHIVYFQAGPGKRPSASRSRRPDRAGSDCGASEQQAVAIDDGGFCERHRGGKPPSGTYVRSAGFDPARIKKEGRRSGPKSREETPTWAATEKTRRGTGSRQTARSASTTFEFRDPHTCQSCWSSTPRLAPAESKLIFYAADRLKEMLIRGISTS